MSTGSTEGRNRAHDPRKGERASGSLTYRCQSGGGEKEQEQQGDATELREGLHSPLDADSPSVRICSSKAEKERGRDRKRQTRRDGGERERQLFHMGKFRALMEVDSEHKRSLAGCHCCKSQAWGQMKGTSAN